MFTNFSIGVQGVGKGEDCVSFILGLDLQAAKIRPSIISGKDNLAQQKIFHLCGLHDGI